MVPRRVTEPDLETLPNPVGVKGPFVPESGSVWLLHALRVTVRALTKAIREDELSAVIHLGHSRVNSGLLASK